MPHSIFRDNANLTICIGLVELGPVIGLLVEYLPLLISMVDRWSEAATHFLDRQLRGQSQVSVVYAPDSQVHVRMYLHDMCINDEMVCQRLALPAPKTGMPKMINIVI